MNNEWKEYKLNNIANINMGQSPDSKFYNLEGIGLPFLQGNRTFGLKFPTFDTFCTDPKKIAYEGDILFSVRAPVGDINIANTKICIGRGLCSISSKTGNNSFLYYLLNFLKNEIINSESGTVFGSVNKDDLNNISVNIPVCINEQNVIASILSSLDDKIDLLHRQNKTLEQLAETLFRQWFVEEAEESWGKDKLGNLFDIGIGRTPPRKEHQWFTLNPNDMKWISIKDIGNTKIYIDTVSEYLTREAVERFNIPIISPNTVLLSFKLTVGRVAITTENMLSNEAIAHFKLKKGTKLFTEFLYLFLKSFQYEILGSTSSIAEAINSKTIRDIEIYIPGEDKLIYFRSIIEPIFQKIKSNSKHIKTLTQLRDTLLPKLMSGEVRVKFN
jgi:type I restriction enzyme S subunit